MTIKQFEYAPLSHYSYAISSEGLMAIIDPERNPLQYYIYAASMKARIVAVIETHPHADFVSSHLQIQKETGARIYNSEKTGADYPFTPFDEGDVLHLGDIALRALNTPGHSPDSITIVAKEKGETALFTGDTLFIGDVGRPDLREKAGNLKAKRQELAGAMYETINSKFDGLPDDALIYPAHGAGSLCGKSLSSANSSTLGNERIGNWAFEKRDKDSFIEKLLDSQPFIPSYFGFDVDLNKTGAETLRPSIANIPFRMNAEHSASDLIIDVRAESDFKSGHLQGSINIQATSKEDKFETWLGAIIKPNEKFDIVVKAPENLENVLERVAKIGYESQVETVITLGDIKLSEKARLDVADFTENPERYTIIDIRNGSEFSEGKFFESALNFPLNDLRQNLERIPVDRPIVVHCAGGYRSAAGSSILAKFMEDVTVYDLGDTVKKFK